MDITFANAPIPGGIAATCSICGAVVFDWEVNRDGSRSHLADGPNQDRHADWHERNGF